MSKQYKLCFVDDNILFFTDNFKNQWGDDWNDAPYEHNAGEPYDRKDYPEYDDKWCVENGKGNIRKIAFDFYDGYNIQEPKDGHYNSPYSVEAVNKKAVPWLYNEEAGALFAGATMAEAKRWLKKAGVRGVNYMSKRQTDILSERLKDRLTKIKNDAELALVAVEEIGDLEITCFKCHGEGKYYTLTQYQYEREQIKSHKCLICKGTGKISLQFYEDIQKRCRR